MTTEMKYRRKKPAFIEAFQMTHERYLDNSEWPVWLQQAWQKLWIEVGALFSDGCLATETHSPLLIQTSAGSRKVNWDDWIIKEWGGQLQTCDHKTFEAIFEPIDKETT